MTVILRNRRLALLVACCAALVGIAAGCGGSSENSDVPKGAVAVVDHQVISQAEVDKAGEQYKRSAKKGGHQAIGCCNDAWKTTVQQKIVPYLVQKSEFEQQAKKLGAVVTAAEVDKQIDKIVDQYFNKDRKKFLAAAKKQGANLEDVRQSIRLNLLQ